MDRDKLTFIMCRSPPDFGQGVNVARHDDPSVMIGDVNVFFSESLEDRSAIIGELELMVAVQASRRQGFGKASSLAMLEYIGQHEDQILAEFDQDCRQHTKGIEHMKVKSGAEKENSGRFFESLGCKKVSDAVDYFGEFELRLSWQARHSQCPGLQELSLLGYSELLYEAA